MKGPKKEMYDVAVIGGGPAGMMAAGRAAELGASVILIEKNTELGKKLLITGGGRCNLTNDIENDREFLAKLGNKGKFLFSTFALHSVKDTLDFFHKKGLSTKVENEGRVFPVSDSARSVRDVLVKYMKDNEVEILTGISAKGFHAYEGKIEALNVSRKEGAKNIVSSIKARSYILATGGASHPETGSTGEAFEWLESIGHKVIQSDSALVPVKIFEKWVRDLSGVSQQNVKITILKRNEKEKKESRGEWRKGRMVFAHFGLSGPLVLNFSKEIKEAMSYAKPDSTIMLSLDLLPDFDNSALDKKLQAIFALNGKKKIKNALKEIIDPALCQAVINLAKIDPEKEVSVISREERLSIVKTLKDMRMTPVGFMGKEKAIVASGGVCLEEVDFRTMRSRLFSNLYLIGDVLDIDRPSGGFSLQICWSTGFVAGSMAATKNPTR